MKPDMAVTDRSTLCKKRITRNTKYDDKGVPIPQEELEFGYRSLGYPTKRRVVDSRRYGQQIPEDNWLKLEIIIQQYPNFIGKLADTTEKRSKAKHLLAKWVDVFVKNVRDLPATDLVVHRIPTYDHARPVKARSSRYTPEEEEHERQSLPALINALDH